MAVPLVFDFTAYLREYLSLPSENSFQVEPLSGGLTNYTVRAVFAEPVAVPGVPHSTRYKSLILKHAPPYIASLGPDHALSTRRQIIEARALKIFADGARRQDTNLRDLLRRHPNIRIPHLLHHDEQKCIIVMSDLGPVPDLLDYLMNSRGDLTNPAATLAAFLADIHLSTKGISGEIFSEFENADSSGAIQELVGPLPRKILKSAGIVDADTLGELVERDLADVKLEPCFGMVDLWPGSILVGDDFVGLVDWEYAGKSTAGGEMGMLIAHLRVPLLSPQITATKSTVISHFLSRILSEYASHMHVRSEAFIRSLLLAHGRELINALEFQSTGLAGDAHKEALTQAGARSIRAAMLDKKGRQNALSEDECLLLRHVF